MCNDPIFRKIKKIMLRKAKNINSERWAKKMYFGERSLVMIFELLTMLRHYFCNLGCCWVFFPKHYRIVVHAVTRGWLYLKS